MDQVRHKVFISYHHANDQEYKEKLLELNEHHGILLISPWIRERLTKTSPIKQSGRR